ncbi:MAG: ceramidase domain-containing protein [Bacteroidetes bacterium]|nr:ceramidase domain-containing protein [Bacteroidota bacterium]MBL7104222.1 ceramidase domain-containing protein [Bacteroidales bacterium]
MAWEIISYPVFQSQSDWYNQRLPDNGPVYTETNTDNLIVEPWNAVSSLLIIIPAIYWMLRIRKDFGNFKFLFYCIFLMFICGTGSTLYHALRASKFFLYMDILPAATITLSISIYFWIKVFKKWWYVLFVIIPSLFTRSLFFRYLPQHTAINVSYAISGIITALPLVIILFKTGFYKVNYVIITIVLFILALIFREIDATQISFLPMGTHFLWHVFSGFGAYYILAYLYHFRKREIIRFGSS